MAKKLNILKRFNKSKKMDNEQTDNKEEILNEQEIDATTDTPSEDVAKESNTVEKTPLEIKEDELQVANDKYLRLYSEFDNFRRKTAKEKIGLMASAGESVIKDLLPILENFRQTICF